jgi:hypothetical protein
MLSMCLADGRLHLSYEAQDDKLDSLFGTRFAAPQDLTAHSLLTFT